MIKTQFVIFFINIKNPPFLESCTIIKSLMLKKLCLWFLVPLLFSLTFFILVRLPSPKSRTLIMQGSHKPINLTRDAHGIPHVEADTLEEALYGLGYAMCEDRMWQIDMLRRLSTGRLSEIFGSDSIETDVFMRNVKLHELGFNDVANLDPKTKKVAKNFVQGINDAAHEAWLPLEYYLVNHSWDNFTEADSQSMLYLTAFFLSMLWGNDVLKVHVQGHVGGLADLLLPTEFKLINPRTFIVDDEDLDDSLKGKEELIRARAGSVHGLGLIPDYFDQGSGSNGWVISGNHTESGKPVFSNDPHLSCSVPSLWYLNHLKVRGKSIFGVNSIGYPMSAIGRTDKFVWGITASKVDDVDIYEEKIINDTHYVYGDQNLKFEEKIEVIKVRGQKDSLFNIRSTVHGPLLEERIRSAKKFVHSLPEVRQNNLSFAWTGFGNKDRSMDFTWKIFEVSDIHEFRELMGGVTAIKLGVVAGSMKGDILYQTVGRAPIRSARGDSILPGWDPKYTWQGYIPFTSLPYSINPKKGFIVAANNFITSESYKYSSSLGHYFCQGRADRISSFISSKISSGHKFTSKDQLSLLQDEYDIGAFEALPILLSKLSFPQNASSSYTLLKSWDYIMSKESKAATIYANWLVQISKNLLKTRLPEDILTNCIRSNLLQIPMTNFFQSFYPDLSEMCDDPKTEKVETCADIISLSFDEAVKLADGKRWGESHKITMRHNPFSLNRWIAWIFERSAESGGWGTTVHAVSSNWAAGMSGNHGPGVKFVADLGNRSEGYWSLESGVSGNVLGRHYDDMFSQFHYGEIPRFEFN